jgi:hypothetical protein
MSKNPVFPFNFSPDVINLYIRHHTGPVGLLQTVRHFYPTPDFPMEKTE